MDSNILDLFLSSSSDEEYLLEECKWMNKMIVEAARLISKENPHPVRDYEKTVNNYSDEEFREHFRVSRRTAEILTNKFASSRFYIKRSNTSGRTPISAETQCLSFLWFAGNKHSYKDVSKLFNITSSSVHRCQTHFLEFLFDISSTYIKMPSTSAMKENVSQSFEKIAGFKNVLGCIGGSNIYIRKPVHKIRSSYVNRHGLRSITLQGICDADNKFLDVFVGATSKIQDCRIFKLSQIYPQLPNICKGKYHILGGVAYPLREYLLTPYRDCGDLSEQQKKYNRKHRQTRVKIENAFSLLKQRFRQLLRLDFFTVERMSKFVVGCCVLHNLCIDEGDLWTDAPETERPTSEEDNSRTATEKNGAETESHADGERKRNMIAATME